MASRRAPSLNSSLREAALCDLDGGARILVRLSARRRQNAHFARFLPFSRSGRWQCLARIAVVGELSPRGETLGCAFYRHDLACGGLRDLTYCRERTPHFTVGDRRKAELVSRSVERCTNGRMRNLLTSWARRWPDDCDKRPMTDICALDAVTLTRQFEIKTISAVEATRASIARMEALEPTLQCVLHADARPRLEDGRACRRSDRGGRGSRPRSPAFRSASRISFAQKGIRTVSGSPAYENFVPEEDDIVVERAIAAGAIILGKTNVPEFGYSGVGHNPVFPDHAQPVEPAAHVGRLERRLRRGGGIRQCARSPLAATAAARCASPPRIAACSA